MRKPLTTVLAAIALVAGAASLSACAPTAQPEASTAQTKQATAHGLSDESATAWRAFAYDVDTADLRTSPQAYNVEYIGTGRLEDAHTDIYTLVGVDTGTAGVYHLFKVTQR